MTTKNLARTVIEGGRQHYNKFERHHSNEVARVRAHALERALAQSADPESVCFEPRRPVRRSFSDKLGPARRWLRSQVGRPWNKVTSCLFQRFDIRTTSGRHIVFCHLLREVDHDGQPRHGRREFVVDAHGILRLRADARARPRVRTPLPEAPAELGAWLGGRRVIEQGERVHWLELTEHGAYRQTRRLSATDTRRWRSLPTWFREQFSGPVRLDPQSIRALTRTPLR